MKRYYLLSLFFICCIFFLSLTKVQAASVEALGWGWIGTSASPDPLALTATATPGLISFNCENLDEYYVTHGGYNCGDPERPDYKVRVDYAEGTTSGNLFGWAWIGFASPYGIYTTGWIKFSDEPDGYLNVGEDYPFSDITITGANYDDTTGEVSGWARIMELGRYGWETYGSNEWGWVKLRGTWGSGSGSYGVTFNPDEYTNKLAEGYEYDTYGKFAGWAWSGDSPTGLGWLQFDIGVTEDVWGNAWLQTDLGDIYSQHGISLSVASPDFNAAYFILADEEGSIQNFSTALTGGIIENYGTLYFPAEDSGVYRSNIGKIDLNSLRSNAIEISSVSEIDNPLDGNIYQTPGNTGLIIDGGSLTIANGTLGTFGNGTIIVNGDLEINENIYYLDTNISDIRELPSIAWIVTGDLTIAPYVTDLAGAFIVLGNDGVATGIGNQQLEVQGLMMAKQFNFGRTRTREEGGDLPSEKIIYDGRALANTPPGLEDLIATLPELGIAE